MISKTTGYRKLVDLFHNTKQKNIAKNKSEPVHLNNLNSALAETCTIDLLTEDNVNFQLETSTGVSLEFDRQTLGDKYCDKVKGIPTILAHIIDTINTKNCYIQITTQPPTSVRNFASLAWLVFTPDDGLVESISVIDGLTTRKCVVNTETEELRTSSVKTTLNLVSSSWYKFRNKSKDHLTVSNTHIAITANVIYQLLYIYPDVSVTRDLALNVYNDFTPSEYTSEPLNKDLLQPRLLGVSDTLDHPELYRKIVRALTEELDNWVAGKVITDHLTFNRDGLSHVLL